MHQGSNEKNVTFVIFCSFAYIVFEKVESVSNAVEKLNGAEFQDRHIRVDVCKPVCYNSWNNIT